MKESKMNYPNPFDDSAIARLNPFHAEMLFKEAIHREERAPARPVLRLGVIAPKVERAILLPRM